MVIRIAELIGAADTEAQGGAVYARLADAMRRGDIVTVSFGGVHSATSSFVNAAFLPLLRDFSFDDIKRRVRITNSTGQINDMIKLRLRHEASTLAEAA